MAKFLDENGVKKLWSRIQEYVYECCCSKGGGGDVGYECKDGYETFWKGNVTTRDSTEGDWAYNRKPDQVITAEKIRVMFQGTAYDFERRVVEGSSRTFYEYGEFTADAYNPIPILKNQPIAIISNIPNGSKTSNSGMLKGQLKPRTSVTIFTRTSGSYNIEIQTPCTIVETTECFQKAVKSVSGYDCTTSFEKAFSESGATTKGEGSVVAQYTLDYTDYIDVDEIKVVFNGTEYICPKMIEGTSVAYGSSTPDFEDYPFTLALASNLNDLYTPDPMDFEITVFVPVTTATVTPCFETAVETVMKGKGVKVIHIEADEEEGGFVCDTSCDEITETIQNGGYVVAYYNGNFYNLDVTSGSTTTFARIDINTQTQQAERKGFTFDMNDCSITYFPSYS